MSGPIVRMGTNPKFWDGWDNVFGAGAGKKTPAKAAAKKAPRKAAKKSAKKAPKKK
jgi:hypothetical protein